MYICRIHKCIYLTQNECLTCSTDQDIAEIQSRKMINDFIKNYDKEITEEDKQFLEKLRLHIKETEIQMRRMLIA